MNAKKLIYSSMLVVALSGIALLSSCSDDNGTNNNQQISQEQFAQFRALADTLITPLATSLLSGGVSRLDGVNEDDYGLGKVNAPDQDSVFLVYHPVSGWWEAFLSSEADAGSDPFHDIELRDSIQFKSLTATNQIIPDDNTDYMHEITRADIFVESDSLSSMVSVAARCDAIFDDLQSEVATVNGDIRFSITFEVDSLGETIAGTATATLDVEDLEVPIPASEEDDTCPISGIITYTLVENITSQIISDETFDVTWSVRVTIVDAQTYLVKITAGNLDFDEYVLGEEYVCDQSGLSTVAARALQLSQRD